MKGFANEIFSYIRAVRIRRIEQIDPELDRAAQNGKGFGTVAGFAPNAGAGELHGAEAEPVHGKLAADLEAAAFRGRSAGSARNGLLALSDCIHDCLS